MSGGKRRAKYSEENEDYVEIEERTRDSTVCLPLSQNKCKFLFADTFLQVIRKKVKGVTKMAYFGSILANAHICAYLRGIPGVTLPAIDTNFFDLCLLNVTSAATSPTKKKAAGIGLDKTYRTIFGDAPYVVEVSHLQNITKYMAGRMVTHYELYHWDWYVLASHVKKYFMAKFGFDRKTAASLAKEIVFSENDFQDPGITGDVLRIRRAKEDPEFRLRLRYQMIESISEKSSQNDKGFENFSMIPMSSMTPQFIDIDKQTMKTIWGEVSPGRLKRTSTGEHVARYTKWKDTGESKKDLTDWFTYPKRGRDWVPGALVRTNGYEIHYIFDKNKGRMESGKSINVKKNMVIRADDWEPERVFSVCPQIDAADVKNFVSVDPGNVNVVSWATPTGYVHANGTPEMKFGAITKKYFKHKTLQTGIQKLYTKFRARDPQLKQAIAAMSECTNKTVSLTALHTLAQTALTHFDTFLKYTTKKDYMKLKAASRIKRMKHIDEICNRVSENGNKYVGFGDGSRNSGLRGTSSGGPVAVIRRHMVKKGMRVTLVDEAYTSKRVCCCRGVDHLKVRTPAGKEIHGLLTCPSCKRTWNRDFMACINIFDVFYNHMVRGGPRPPHLVAHPLPARPSGTWWAFCAGRQIRL